MSDTPATQQPQLPTADLKSPDGAVSPVSEELPPVKPPSAGFIVQLFLIPALIVVLVVSVWFLFSALAHSESEWTRLVENMASRNEHVRWQAAHELAQLLHNERVAGVEPAERLSTKPEVAEAIIDALQTSLSKGAVNDENEVTNQVFLLRTLGMLENDKLVIPVLVTAVRSNNALDSRQSAWSSVAMIAFRRFASAQAALLGTTAAEQESQIITADRPLPLPTIDDAELLASLEEASRDNEVIIRVFAALNLGVISGDESIEILRQMLNDADVNVRANAAIGLARNGLTDGVPVFHRFLKDSLDRMPVEEVADLPQAQQKEIMGERMFSEPVRLRNTLNALSELWDRIDEPGRAELVDTLQKVADGHPSAQIRTLAKAVLLQAAGNTDQP